MKQQKIPATCRFQVSLESGIKSDEWNSNKYIRSRWSNKPHNPSNIKRKLQQTNTFVYFLYAFHLNNKRDKFFGNINSRKLALF